MNSADHRTRTFRGRSEFPTARWSRWRGANSTAGPPTTTRKVSGPSSIAAGRLLRWPARRPIRAPCCCRSRPSASGRSRWTVRLRNARRRSLRKISCRSGSESSAMPQAFSPAIMNPWSKARGSDAGFQDAGLSPPVRSHSAAGICQRPGFSQYRAVHAQSRRRQARAVLRTRRHRERRTRRPAS